MFCLLAGTLMHTLLSNTLFPSLHLQRVDNSAMNGMEVLCVTSDGRVVGIKRIATVRSFLRITAHLRPRCKPGILRIL